MSTANKVLQNEVVTFIQQKLPGFRSGTYELTVSQELVDSPGINKINTEPLTNTYEFTVQGDRFFLSEPSTLIDSVFPPADAAGEFNAALPHVVFTNTSFPWSRNPKDPIINLAGMVAAPPDAPTWLYVLLLDETDAVPALAPAAATIRDLLPSRLNKDSTLKENYSYFYMAETGTQEHGQALSDPIQYVDLPLEFFWTIAPTLADLELAAHVREVNLLVKATEPGGEGPGVPLGTYSIVFGNRLPQSEKKTYAYLVSLEGLGPLLPNDDGSPPAGGFDGKKMLRLAVLNSWTFASVGQPSQFIDQLLELNGRLDPHGPDDAVNTNLRLEYSGTNPLIRDAATMGYAPMNTTVRTGETAVSWYRGPLAPYLPKLTVKVPLASADEANAFDPTTGVFDQSHGAAWTLGRLIALQDTGFSTALYNWKQGLTQKVIDQIEGEIISARFSGVLERNPTPAFLNRPGANTSARALLHKTMQALGQAASQGAASQAESEGEPKQ